MLENYKVEYYDYDYYKNKDQIRKIKPRKNKFKNIVMTVLLCSIAVSITCRYVRITRLNYDINRMENELITINGENQNLNVKLAETENLNEIERIARSKLHMHEPTEENLVYVVVNNYNIAKSESSQQRIKNRDFDTFFVKIFGTIIR
ncbi:MAG: cell division protein FtsL [Thermoanaerobacteraceae bacterium]|nr:cell division protein FtsL [Thermoanaerobacteraceae bacterium]